MAEKIIIDTDIGDDIDDALALALALRSPELELLGITTVFKNTGLRAGIARSLLKTAGAGDIPVVPGLGKPLQNIADCGEVPPQYKDWMGGDGPFRPGDAVDYLIESVKSRPGEVTLVPIGALTNIAAALVKAPEIKDEIRHIVLMGGAYYTHKNEWNIVCDPEAARIVFDAGVPILGVGLDVTLRCCLSEEETARLMGSAGPLGDFLGTLISLYKVRSGGWPIYLHDPLAVAAAFDESFVTQEERRIGVELRGEFTRGMTVNLSEAAWRKEDKSHVRVCREVDRERFVRFFLDRVCGER